MSNRLGELNALEEAEAEQVSGMPITVLENDEAPKVKILGALAWVHAKRTDPKVSYTEYMKAHRMREIVSYLFGSDDADAEEGEDGEADPFPEGGTADEGAAPGGVADAAGPVLSGDRDSAE